jgi:primosomal protein N' (replication factor Y) (superfamily II helicase)
MPAEDASCPGPAAARVQVLLPLPLAGAYDYAVAEGEEYRPGDFVAAPLGRRLLPGVVWAMGPADPENPLPEKKLRRIAGALPVPAMAVVTRRFVDWVAAYTCADAGSVLRMAMSVASALEPPRLAVAYRLDGPPPERLTPARRRVIALLVEGPPRTAADLAEAAGVGVGVVRGLAAAGTLAELLLPEELRPPRPDWRLPGPALNAAQAEAATALRDTVKAGGYATTLLDGVTGAGKTEVYFEAIAEALAQDRQVLVLVPEITLTAQWLSRFEARFGAPPTEWHSELRASQRRRHWRQVAENQAKVVVGARSALFLPYADLGLIVVDEEHESAFKQEDGVCYHARDMAVVRASLGEIPIVLVSATPSLESTVNVEAGRYRRLHLPERSGGASLPEIAAVDMRGLGLRADEWLSPELVEAVTATLDAGEQALLFLNRRGYAPLTLCRACGHRLQCPNCSAWLVEHRFHERLQCHHCGFSQRLPERCPNCEAERRFAACGPGVERLLEEAERLFPGARAEIVASDTVRGPKGAAELIRRIAEHEIDLIVGTQIVAKGHNFPMLTCVGVVDADLGLAGGDLRAAERTHQLLSQISGRAGRARHAGRALLQTYMPEHPVIRALVSDDRDAFMAREAEARREQGMPPFGRLVALIVSGPDPEETAEAARRVARHAPRGAEIEVLGPAPAPLSLLRGQYRQRLLLRTARHLNASEITRRWLAPLKLPNAVRVRIDVDPYSFL